MLLRAALSFFLFSFITKVCTKCIAKQNNTSVTTQFWRATIESKCAGFRSYYNTTWFKIWCSTNVFIISASTNHKPIPSPSNVIRSTANFAPIILVPKREKFGWASEYCFWQITAYLIATIESMIRLWCLVTRRMSHDTSKIAFSLHFSTFLLWFLTELKVFHVRCSKSNYNNNDHNDENMIVRYGEYISLKYFHYTSLWISISNSIR